MGGGCNGQVKPRSQCGAECNSCGVIDDCAVNRKEEDICKDVLVFRQTAGTYIIKDEWKNKNSYDPTSDNYSILDQLEDFRDDSGKFDFMITWPQTSGADDPDVCCYEHYYWACMGGCNGQIKPRSQCGAECNSCGVIDDCAVNKKPTPNRWTQTSNPLDSKVAGYVSIDTPANGNHWGGLEYNTGPDSLIDGSVNDDSWWYTIGSTQAFNGGIPGAESVVTRTELYVRACSADSAQ